MIELTLGKEEASVVLRSLKSSLQHLKSDSRHAREARMVQSLVIRLEAELKAAYDFYGGV